MAVKPSGKKAKGQRSCRQPQAFDNRGIERRYYVINCVFTPITALLALLTFVLACLNYFTARADPPEREPKLIIIQAHSVQEFCQPATGP